MTSFLLYDIMFNIKYLQNHKSKRIIVLMLLVTMLLLLNLSNLVAFAEEVNPNIQFEKLDLEEELKSISTFDFGKCKHIFHNWCCN